MTHTREPLREQHRHRRGEQHRAGVSTDLWKQEVPRRSFQHLEPETQRAEGQHRPQHVAPQHQMKKADDDEQNPVGDVSRVRVRKVLPRHRRHEQRQHCEPEEEPDGARLRTARVWGPRLQRGTRTYPPCRQHP